MNHPLRTLAVCLVALCTVLPAQEGEKSKPQEPAKAGNAATNAPPKALQALAQDPAIQAIDKFIAEQKIDKTAAGWKTRLPEPPKLPFDADTDYFWCLDTEVGVLRLRWFPDVAPMHVSSGVYLARLGFYDGLTFHRIIPGFMAQGGDPLGNGRGGPGYKMAGEFKGRSHDKPGILSMANAGPGTDGSQFFITFGETRQLDRGYTIWGEVVDGLETLKKLEAKGRPDNNGMLDTPVKIHKAWLAVEPKAKGDAKAKDAATPKAGEQPGPGKGK